jgi:hypothetical protein
MAAVLERHERLYKVTGYRLPRRFLWLRRIMNAEDGVLEVAIDDRQIPLFGGVSRLLSRRCYSLQLPTGNDEADEANEAAEDSLNVTAALESLVMHT